MGATSETTKTEGWGKIRKIGRVWSDTGERAVTVDLSLLSQAAFGTSYLLIPISSISDQDLPLAVPGSRVFYRDFHRVTESGQKERVQTVKLFPAATVEGEE
jgi:hypothetical protein